MATEIIVPRLGWSMEEGAFVAWLKKDGDVVKAGDPLFSIEGDKAVQEIESIDSGVLRIAPNAPKPGDPIHVGDLLGHLLAANEAASGSPGSAANVETKPRPPAVETRPVLDPVKTAVTTSESKVAASERPRLAISPRALRVAAELGVDWTTLTGSGRAGRIRERDVLAAANKNRSPATSVDSTRGPVPERLRRESPLSAVFFGELLLRLATRRHERFVQAGEFEVRYTGAEANAAVSLAQFGVEACVVSAVPEHELGQACLNYLRQFGLRTDHVLRRGSRLGTFYLETGAPPRPSQVIYDRAGSAFSELKPGDLNWDEIFAGRQWFHWSGTAPALGPGLPAVIAEACAAAKRHGLRVSCDLNYRAKLWSAEAARSVMTPLMRHVDVLVGNEEHIGLMLGVRADSSATGKPLLERHYETAKALRSRFPFSAVAMTLRETVGPDPSQWQCLLVNERGHVASRVYPVGTVDRIGAGDAFAGALIYGLMTRMADAQAIEFAAAAGCLKHSIPGDFSLVRREEVLALVQGEAGHRVQR